MKLESFLKGFLRFSGIVEIVFAVMFLGGKYICEFLEVECIPFFYLFTAVELGILGFLLFYSTQDMKRYLVIIVTSCIFRYIMLGPNIYTMITIPSFRPILYGALVYDFLSASLTLFLVWKIGYFSKEQIAKIDNVNTKTEV